MKTLGLCCDHAGYELKEYVKQILDSKGLSYKDFGTCSAESCDYPDFAHPLAYAVEARGSISRNSDLRLRKWYRNDFKQTPGNTGRFMLAGRNCTTGS